jgi:hypothetical protein
MVASRAGFPIGKRRVGLDPEHFGTVLRAFFGEGGRCRRGGESDTARSRMDATAMRILNARSRHGAARRPAVDDRDANTLGWHKHCRKRVRRQWVSREPRPRRTMTTLQAFLLGLMVGWTPSLVLLGWFLLRLLEDRKNDVTDKPA